MAGENDDLNPLVSVVIPNYNYGRYLKQCVQSVLNQTYCKLEIVIVDDASTDESHLLYAEFEDDERITVLENQKNSGVVLSRNRGIAAAKGGYIAFLDPDDEWLPTKLARQMEAIGTCKCSIACSSLLIVDENSGKQSIRRSLFTQIDYQNFLKSNSIPHSSVIIKSVLIKQLEYREVLNPFFEKKTPFIGRWATLIHEDYALLLKLLKNGASVCYIDEPLVVYRKHPSSYSGNVLKKLLSIYVIFRYQEGINFLTALAYTARLMLLATIKNRREAL